MIALLRLLLVPLRAPMLLLLVAVSIYLGLHWSHSLDSVANTPFPITSLLWTAQCAQAMLVVVFCCMPDLLLRRFSVMLAASRVVTLVATLLLVTIGGLYLLHLEVFSNVLILASTVLLARLDLIRIRIVPPPLALASMLGLVVLLGASFGHQLESTHFRSPEAMLRHTIPPLFRSDRFEPGFKRMPLYGRVGSASNP
jgi:hypothetical protein